MFLESHIFSMVINGYKSVHVRTGDHTSYFSAGGSVVVESTVVSANQVCAYS